MGNRPQKATSRKSESSSSRSAPARTLSIPGTELPEIGETLALPGLEPLVSTRRTLRASGASTAPRIPAPGQPTEAPSARPSSRSPSTARRPLIWDGGLPPVSPSPAHGPREAEPGAGSLLWSPSSETESGPSVAALFVERRGSYFGAPGIELWDEKRDARTYSGPHPVVAHPPCSRWCRLAGLVQARWGHKKGDDGGCFASALASVRRWGGVLEHPAYSDAWLAHGLVPPVTGGGWTSADFEGGWTCYVEQGRYGHAAKKGTWLYACGLERLPSLRWGSSPDQRSESPVSWCGNHVASGENRPRLGKAAAIATPAEFRAELLAIARQAKARP